MKPLALTGLLFYLLPILLGWAGTGLSGLGLLLLSVAFFLAWRRGDWIFLEWPRRFLSARALGAVALVGALWWAIAFFDDYWTFDLQTWDLGFIASNVAAYNALGHYYSPFFQVSALADHFTPGLLAFAPLLQLWPNVAWFLIAKWVAYLASAFWVYKIAALHLASRWRYLPPAMWFVMEISHNLMFFHLQANHYAPPFFLAGLYLLMRDRFWAAMLVLAPTLLLKEDMALVYCLAGMFLALYQNRWVQGGAVIGFGVAVGLSLALWLIPYWSGVEKMLNIGGFGPFALIPQKLRLVVLFQLAFGGVLLLDWRAALWSTAGLAIPLVSNRYNLINLSYHYHSLALAAGLVGLVYLLARFERGQEPAWLGPPSGRRRLGVGLALLFLFLAFNQKTPGWRIRMNHYNLLHSSERGFYLPRPQIDWGRAHAEVARLLEQTDPNTRAFAPTHLQPYLLAHWNLSLFEGFENFLPEFVESGQARLVYYFTNASANDLSPAQFAELKRYLGWAGTELLDAGGEVEAMRLRPDRPPSAWPGFEALRRRFAEERARGERR